MEIIRIQVKLNGEQPAIKQLERIDTLITDINKRQVNVKVNNGEAAAANKSVQELGTSAGTAAKQSKLLGDTLSMIKFTAIAAAIGGVTAAMKGALDAMKGVDTQLTNIQKVSNMTQVELDRLGDKAYSTASKYGVAAEEYLSAVYTFQKAGLGDSAEQLGELATKTMLVGDTTADVASKFLIATNAAFGLGGSMSALSTVVDEADYINNNYATSLDKLAAAMPIVASTSANLGMSVEQTMAVIGTITSITQETGTKAATAWRALAMNITGELGSIVDETGETIEVTQQSVESIADAMRIYGNDAVKAAQQTGQLINPMDAVISLAQAYRDGLLTDIELQNILMNVGGKLRTNQLTALVKDLASETSIYYDIMSNLPNAAGTADAEIGIMLSSWESKTEILKNTWTEFIQKTISTDAVKGVLDVATALLDFGDNLAEVVVVLGSAATAIKVISTAYKTHSAAIAAAKLAQGSFATETAKATAELEAQQAAQTAATAASKLWVAGIAAGITVITVAIQALQQYRESQIEAARAAAEEHANNAESYKAEADSLDQLIAKYKELASDGISTDEQEQVAKIQDAINALIGDEFYAVELVNGAYDDQIAKLEQIQTAIEGRTQVELEAARKEAEIALIRSTRGLLGEAKGGAYSSAGADRSIFNDLSAFSFDDAWDSFSGSDMSQIRFQWGKTGEEIVATYDDISEAISRMSEQYSGAELASNGLYTWLQKNQAEVRDAVETYRSMMEDANGDADKQAEAEQAFQEAMDAVAESADGAAEAINRVTKAKAELDDALNAPAQDAAFTSIAQVYKDFMDEVDSGRINSNAFWKDAEFLLGPEVMAQVGDNYEEVIRLIEESRLGEVFAGTNENAKDFIDALNAAADAEGNVADGAAQIREENGKTKVVVNSVGDLAKAWGMTEDQVFAALQALQEFGAFDFDGSTLLEYLDYLGVAFDELSGFNFTNVVQQLSALGYPAQYIKDIVDRLQAMNAIDMGGFTGSIADIQAVLGGATDAATVLNSELSDVGDKSFSRTTSGLQGVGDAAGGSQKNVQNLITTLDRANGKRVTTTFQQNYVTNYSTNYTTTGSASSASNRMALQQAVANSGLRFATGTSNAPGGPALVGDERSPDGSPRPELISDRGGMYLAGTSGPEIVRLNPGATVFTASETRDILQGHVRAYATGTTTKITIRYNANGGSGGPSTTTATKGKASYLSNLRPTRSGYTFLGWGRTASATSAVWQPGGTITAYSNQTLYAVWRKNATTSSSSSSSKSTSSSSTTKSSTSNATFDNLKTVTPSYTAASTATYQNTPMTNTSSSGSGYSGSTSYTTSTSSYSDGGGSYYSGGGGGGGSYSSGGGSSSTTESEPDPRDVLRDKIAEDLKQREYQIWLGQKNGTMTPQQVIQAYQSAMAAVHDYAEQFRKMGEGENSQYVQDLVKQWWNYSDEVKDIQSDLIDEMKDAVEAQLDEAEKIRDERIKAIKDAADAEEDLNELEERRLALLEAQDALLNAQSQRTVRIYNAATGQWEWVADAASVKSATDSVAKAQKALTETATEQAREAQIAAIEAEYDKLTEAWDDILKGLEEPSRALSTILNELKATGTDAEKKAAGSTGTLSENIATAILTMNAKGSATDIDGKSIMYGASPNAMGGVVVGTASTTSDGGVNYYINGVEISGAQAESMTIADLARSLSTLAIYNNS